MSGYLLDSHAVLWTLSDDPRLSTTARDVIADEGNAVLVSDVSLYELMFKASRGRLPESILRLPDAIEASALPILGIKSDAIRAAAVLDWEHGDPWDRILLGQAVTENLTLISKDAVFDAVTDRRVW